MFFDWRSRRYRGGSGILQAGLVVVSVGIISADAESVVHVIQVDGTYTPTMTLDATYLPTRTLDGTYLPTLALDGAVED